MLLFLFKYWKYVALFLGAVALGYFAWHAVAKHYEAKYQPLIDAEHTGRLQAEANLQAERQNFERAQSASKGYQDALQNLRDTIDHAPPPLRLRCRASSPARVPETDTAGGPRSTPARTGALPEDSGFDIADPSPRLYAEADRADRLSEQLRGCQALFK